MLSSIQKFFLLYLLFNFKSVKSDPNIGLKSYEELNLDEFKFQTAINSNKKQKRQTHSSPLKSPILDTNRLMFTAFNQDFEIFLKRETNLVSHTNSLDVEVRYPSSPYKPTVHLKNDFETTHFYSGYVNGHPKSHVICYFETHPDYNSTNNVISLNKLAQPLIYAQIHMQDDRDGEEGNKTSTVYYIEPKINFSDDQEELKEFKYIIYKTDDIQSDVISNNIFNHTVCKPKHVNETLLKLTSPNLNFKSYLNDLKKNRYKRQKSKDTDDNNPNKASMTQNRCSLALVADYRFFKEIGNSNVKLTTAYLMNIIASINSIFTRTKWLLDSEGDSNQADTKIDDNYGFYIEKIIVNSEPNAGYNEHYNNVNIPPDADRVLELFGNEDWTKYCLAHLFTYTQFENSVLGLAYVSSPLGYTLGGICSKATRSPTTLKFSVNTGLSSYKSTSQSQGRLLQREAELVTAHEFGHNWGSEHDPLKRECTPESGSGGGYYLMYAYSNQGHEKNNYYFSPCSINSISQVLKSSKSKCFKAESLSFCGNDRIEADEECDAGLSGRQGLDPCCDYNCKLKNNAQCSDANDYCCSQCQIAPWGSRCYSSSNYIECFEDHSYCDGTSKTCPSQKPKPKNTKCNSYDSGKCDSAGHCLSLCQQQDIEYLPCKCDKSQAEKCMVCCRNVFSLTNNSSGCLPLHEIFPAYFKSPRYLTNGRPCVEGVCENEKCMQRVKDYVSRFWKVIQTATVSGFLEFMKRNIVGSIIVISLTFWVPMSCCIHFCIDKRNRSEQKKRILHAFQSRMSYKLKQNQTGPDQVDQQMRLVQDSQL
jgi:disintegrin and metalloproteinase domain-containing protein 17